MIVSVPAYRTGMPGGHSDTDEFMKILCEYSGRDIPERYVKERGRLLDSYADAHKYLFGKKALVYGDADFVMGIGSFLAEIGMIPVLCAAGKERNLKETAGKSLERAIDSSIYEHVDFVDIENISRELHPDILIGSSKGYRLHARWGFRWYASASRCTTASAPSGSAVSATGGHRNYSTVSSMPCWKTGRRNPKSATAICSFKGDTNEQSTTARQDSRCQLRRYPGQPAPGYGRLSTDI
jgi:hypothetical protein